ncbi:MAG: FAD/NAD(P)-binding protein [Candidatus Neoclostridium sp.]
MINENLIPKICVVTDIRKDTPDVKTFRVTCREGGKPFEHLPGQCAMVTIPGVGECMFSITSSPTNREYMEFSIKKCGCVTEVIHAIEEGQEIGVRGPYGRNFPVEGDFLGKDMLFIAGGIGLAPLRSVINYIRHYRKNYGKVVVVYGARSKDDLVDIEEIRSEWQVEPEFEVHLTIDRAQEGWDGHVGFVPAFVKELGLNPEMTAVLCGPPIMIKFTLAELLSEGFKKEKVYTTLEMRMKCGIGKCGRCNVGDKFVCKDGPVFRMDELDELPAEY